MRAALTIAVVVGALAVDRLALSTSRGAEVLVPTPERTAQVFMTSVAAHRPEQARERLTAEARREWPSTRLRELDRTWRERDGHYRMAESDESRRGDRAEVRARITTARRGTVQRLFVLERDADTAVWKIALLEAD